MGVTGAQASPRALKDRTPAIEMLFMTDPATFLATAEHRRTDVRILEVILDLADDDTAEAERMWAAPTEVELIDIFVALTDRGLDPEALQWDRMGVLWSRGIQELF